MFTTKMPLVPRSGLVAAAALAVAAIGAPSAGAEITSTSACADPVLTQPFLSSKDSNNYMLVPGQDSAGFNGSGWTLSGGAEASWRLAARPCSTFRAGQSAVSPTVCVTTEYPRARMMVRNASRRRGRVLLRLLRQYPDLEQAEEHRPGPWHRHGDDPLRSGQPAARRTPAVGSSLASRWCQAARAAISRSANSGSIPSPVASLGTPIRRSFRGASPFPRRFRPSRCRRWWSARRRSRSWGSWSLSRSS